MLKDINVGDNKNKTQRTETKFIFYIFNEILYVVS